MHNQRGPKTMRGNKLMVSVLFDPDQIEALDDYAEQRRTSRTQIVREAVDLWLAKQREQQAA